MGVVKERPILFNSEMVRAVLAGRKTQTRRVCKVKPIEGTFAVYGKEAIDAVVRNHSPYGQVGDRLWVRETHTFDEAAPNGVMYRADLPEDDAAAADVIEVYKGSWKPSIFMKREFSRILLEVTNIRVERVQEIAEDDAIAEGVLPIVHRQELGYKDYRNHPHASVPYRVAKFSFESLWDSINANRKDKNGEILPYSWDDNPWVWVVEFKVIEIKEASNG